MVLKVLHVAYVKIPHQKAHTNTNKRDRSMGPCSWPIMVAIQHQHRHYIHLIYYSHERNVIRQQIARHQHARELSLFAIHPSRFTVHPILTFANEISLCRELLLITQLPSAYCTARILYI